MPDTIQYQLDLKGYHVKALKEQKEHIKVIFDE